MRSGKIVCGLDGAVAARGREFCGQLPRRRKVDPEFRSGGKMLLDGVGGERRAQIDERGRASLLKCPVLAVPAQDVGPLLLGGIGDQSSARGLHLHGRGKDIVLRKIGGPEPDAQRRRICRNPFCQIEKLARCHLCAGRAH